ncbi:uncharacterized protein METZ01_LOCUS112925, partial [marine metagenome]
HLTKHMGVGIIIQISAKITVWKIFAPLSKQIISAKSLQEVGQNNSVKLMTPSY